MKIIIDPGHGGHDSGALGPNGIRESDIVLAVSQKLVAKLETRGVIASLTRNDDVFISLSERAAIANRAEADIFVSIHCNSAERPAKGIETFSYPGSDGGKRLAAKIQTSLTQTFANHPDRGIKTARFSVLRKTAMPAVLVELEFIHTPDGENFLSNPAVQDLYALAIANAII